MKLSGISLVGPRDISMLCSIRWTMLGPCLGHIRAMLGHFYNNLASRCLKWLKFSLKHHACQLGEYHSKSNHLAHIKAMYAILRSLFDFFTISLLLDAWNDSNFHWRVMHAKNRNAIQCQIIRIIWGPCLGHIRAIFWLFLQFLASRWLKWLKVLLESCKQNRWMLFVQYLCF